MRRRFMRFGSFRLLSADLGPDIEGMETVCSKSLESRAVPPLSVQISAPILRGWKQWRSSSLEKSL